MSVTARSAITAFAAVCLAASSAFAAPGGLATVDPAAHAKADDLFRAGRAAATAGDNKTACDRFSESEQLEPAPGTQLNLGACEEAQGHILSAREHFRLAIAGFKPDDKRRPLATTRASDLTKRLAHLTVHLAPGSPSDTRIAVAGAPLDAKILEHGIEVDPGKTSLVVTAAGRPPRSFDLDIAEGQSRDLVVSAGDVATTPPAAVEAPASTPAEATDTGGRPSRKLLRTLGFASAGAGGAGILVGSIFGGLAFHEASVVKNNCNAALACQPAGVSAASSGKTDSVVSTAAFIAGGVFVAAGAYLLVTTWKNPAEAKGRETVTLSPTLFYAGGGVTTAWTF